MIQEKNVPASLNTEQEHGNCDDKSICAELGTVEEEELRRKQVEAFSLLGQLPCVPDDGWKTTVGMFDSDPIIREISEQARRIRTSQRDK